MINTRLIFYILFTFSGFSGLIYESIWSHYLKLFLGHAAYAQTLVLAIFMGGMALGSYLCSRFSFRWRNLLKGYAIAEGVVGVFAVFFHPIFDFLTQSSYSIVIPSLPSPEVITLYKWALSAALIFPQSVLLGMTFPLMSAGILRIHKEEPGRTISLLYFTNSIGAAAGVLFSGFILIKSVGLPGTIRTAGFINLALAMAVFLLIRKYAISPQAEPSQQRRPNTAKRDSMYVVLLSISLLTGLASFIYEIGWIRMLSLVLGSSTHSFELMLSAFILGLALGGLWIQKRIDSISKPVNYLMIVQIIMGLFAMATLPVYGNTFKVMQWLLKSLSKTETGYMLFNLSGHAIAMAVMLPATFCAGMTLPLITLLLIRRGHGEHSIGAVYAANTIGAIAGVFLAIHFGMPVLGLKGLMVLGATVDIGLGLLLLWSFAEHRSYRTSVLSTAASAGIIFLVISFVHLDPYKMASGVYRHGSFLSPGENEILYYKDGKTASVSVTYYKPTHTMSIRTNGKPDASIDMKPQQEPSFDELTMILAAVLPMAYNPNAKNVANIGLGSGITTNTLLQNQNIERVDTIEIEKGMVEGARKYGPLVDLVYKDPRSRIHIDDAKTFFSSHKMKYDIIISEPSNPWVSGVAGLFSKEFYHMITRHLTENGLFVQWIQLYEIDPSLVVSILKALSVNFEDFIIYASNVGELIVIAKQHGTIGKIDLNMLERHGIRESLKKIRINSIQDIEIHRIGNKKIFNGFIDIHPIIANSDYYPVVDQFAVKARFFETNSLHMVSHIIEPFPLVEMLSGSQFLRRNTVITVSGFPRSQVILNALALYNHLMQGASHAEIKTSPEMQYQALEARRIFYACNPSEPTKRKKLLFNILRDTIPFLSPEEATNLLQFLFSEKCKSYLSENEKDWIALFDAIGKRAAGRIVSISESLLKNDHDLSNEQYKYLVAANMLGNLSLGKKKESYQIWIAHKDRLFKHEKPTTLFLLLAANSLDNQRN